MKCNVGPIDRILQIIIGIALLDVDWYYQSWWGLIGLVPLLTAVFRICPAYLPFGLSTCARESTDKS